MDLFTIIFYIAVAYGIYWLIITIAEKLKEDAKNKVIQEIPDVAGYESQIKNYERRLSKIFSLTKTEEDSDTIISNRIQDKIQSELSKRCPRCHNGILRLVKGRFGYFYGCTNYPNCRYTKDVRKIESSVKKRIRSSYKKEFIDDLIKILKY